MEKRSFELKLERAREHIKCFEVESRTWIETKPYEIIDEPDPKPPGELRSDLIQARRMFVNVIDPVPQRLRIIIGDCLFNLRSALDHLAYSLAIGHTPGITDKQARDSEFPVFRDLRKFKVKQNQKVGCIAPEAQSIIESLQPCLHGDHSYGPPTLWDIQALNCIDKHRFLTLCFGTPVDEFIWNFTYKNVSNLSYFRPYCVPFPIQATKEDSVIAQWGGVPANPNREMRGKLDIFLEIALGDGSLSGWPVNVALRNMCEFIEEEVVYQLAMFL